MWSIRNLWQDPCTGLGASRGGKQRKSHQRTTRPWGALPVLCPVRYLPESPKLSVKTICIIQPISTCKKACRRATFPACPPLSQMQTTFVSTGLGLEWWNRQGAKFSKWRAALTIDESLPSMRVIKQNATELAEYASVSQVRLYSGNTQFFLPQKSHIWPDKSLINNWTDSLVWTRSVLQKVQTWTSTPCFQQLKDVYKYKNCYFHLFSLCIRGLSDIPEFTSSTFSLTWCSAYLAISGLKYPLWQAC